MRLISSMSEPATSKCLDCYHHSPFLHKFIMITVDKYTGSEPISYALHSEIAFLHTDWCGIPPIVFFHVTLEVILIPVGLPDIQSGHHRPLCQLVSRATAIVH